MFRYGSILGVAAMLGSVGVASAATTPIAFTGYNQDMVIEASNAIPAVVNRVTATMDDATGKATGNYTWYEQGFNTGNPTTGLIAGAGTFTSAADPNTTFQLQPYNGNNVVMFAAGFTSNTLTLTTAAQYSKLSFLTSSGHGDGTLTVKLNFADANPSSTLGTTVASLDWFNNGTTALTAAGRSDVLGAFDAVGTSNPRLYQVDLNLTGSDAAHPISSIDLTWTGSTGITVTALFALSGDLVPVPESSHVLLAAVAGLALVGFARRRFFAAA